MHLGFSERRGPNFKKGYINIKRKRNEYKSYIGDIFLIIRSFKITQTFVPPATKRLRELNIRETENCEKNVEKCELYLEQSKNCGQFANEQIFVAFTYLLRTLFYFGRKSHKIEHTFNAY